MIRIERERCKKMREMKIGEIESSSKGMDRRSISSIFPNWNDMRSSASINELGEIARMTRIKNLNAVCLGWLNTDTKKKNLGEEHKGAIKWSIIESSP